MGDHSGARDTHAGKTVLAIYSENAVAHDNIEAVIRKIRWRDAGVGCENDGLSTGELSRSECKEGESKQLRFHKCELLSDGETRHLKRRFPERRSFFVG